MPTAGPNSYGEASGRDSVAYHMGELGVAVGGAEDFDASVLRCLTMDSEIRKMSQHSCSSTSSLFDRRFIHYKTRGLLGSLQV